MIHGRKVIGIIGGMGPMATADLFIKIVENTAAKTDQEHLHVLIDNNTDIPDRTACILAGSDAPLGPMVESARRLVDQGADVLISPTWPSSMPTATSSTATRTSPFPVIEE